MAEVVVVVVIVGKDLTSTTSHNLYNNYNQPQLFFFTFLLRQHQFYLFDQSLIGIL